MNQFGRALRLAIHGESHGPGIGIVMDGLPPGTPVDAAAIQRALDLRRPGGPLTSQRREEDRVALQSGVRDEGALRVATGAPVALWIANTDAKPVPPGEARLLRPGHADATQWLATHGHADLSGAGHASGRLTAPLVAAAALVEPILARRGITVGAHLHHVGDVQPPSVPFAAAEMARRAAASPVRTAHRDHESALAARIDAARRDLDSVGAVLEFAVDGCPAGLGEPFFDSVESVIAHLLFAIPAVKGVEFGRGFGAATMTGSQHNDPIVPLQPPRAGAFAYAKNDAGGVLGGRTTGQAVTGRVAVKPTSSIAREQATVDPATGAAARLAVTGRHDPCIGVRAVPVVQACVSLALADLILQASARGGA